MRWRSGHRRRARVFVMPRPVGRGHAPAPPVQSQGAVADVRCAGSLLQAKTAPFPGAQAVFHPSKPRAALPAAPGAHSADWGLPASTQTVRTAPFGQLQGGGRQGQRSGFLVIPMPPPRTWARYRAAKGVPSAAFAIPRRRRLIPGPRSRGA